MAFQVVKGWPSYGAIDEMLVPDTDVDLTGETRIAMINTSGKAVLGDYDSTGSDSTLMAAFCIDVDKVTDKVVGLMSRAIIEVDADHYASASYSVGDVLTAIGGKFSAPAGSEPVIAKVISINATTGIMRVLWLGN